MVERKLPLITNENNLISLSLSPLSLSNVRRDAAELNNSAFQPSSRCSVLYYPHSGSIFQSQRESRWKSGRGWHTLQLFCPHPPPLSLSLVYSLEYKNHVIIFLNYTFRWRWCVDNFRFTSDRALKGVFYGLSLSNINEKDFSLWIISNVINMISCLSGL